MAPNVRWMRTYRGTVRGKFGDLTEEARVKLKAEASVHDMMSASFSQEGSFTYDSALDAFSFRYLLSEDAADPEVATSNVHTLGELKATEYLDSNAYAHRNLRVESMSIDD